MRGFGLLVMLLVLAATAARAATADDYLPPAEMKRAIAQAITAEQKAQAAIRTKNWKAATDALDSAIVGLALSLSSAQSTSGDYSAGESQQIVALAKPAFRHDEAARKAVRKHDAKTALAELAAAAPLKHHLTQVVAEVLGAESCTATKEFDVYGIPDGYTGSYAEVYPHGVPKNADHISFSFVDTATGKAPAPQLFPGQTWNATNKGFRADGKLVIRVDVTGTGFGAPDANKKHWKVVVTYDC